MFYFVYVLLSEKDQQFYIGFTPTDVNKRFEKHKAGQVPATEFRRPLQIIFYEAYLNEKDALKRERYFKTTKGKVTLKQMLKNYFGNR